MEPISAFSLASGVIQIVDFAGRILSKSHEIYASAEGTIEEHDFLEHSVKNLDELSTSLSKLLLEELERQKLQGGLKTKPVDRQLVLLCKDCHDVTAKLLAEIDKLKLKGPHSKLKSVQQALRHVGSQPHIQNLKNKLDDIRSQVDTVLLVSLRCDVLQLQILRLATNTNQRST